MFARAKKGLRDEALVVAAKVVALAVLSIAGSSATGLFLYVMASIIYGLYKRMGSLLVMLLVPIMIFGAPLIFMLAPRNGFVGAPLTVAFLVSVLFDVQNLRDRIRTKRRRWGCREEVRRTCGRTMALLHELAVGMRRSAGDCVRAAPLCAFAQCVRLRAWKRAAGLR